MESVGGEERGERSPVAGCQSSARIHHAGHRESAVFEIDLSFTVVSNQVEHPVRVIAALSFVRYFMNNERIVKVGANCDRPLHGMG